MTDSLAGTQEIRMKSFFSRLFRSSRTVRNVEMRFNETPCLSRANVSKDFRNPFRIWSEFLEDAKNKTNDLGKSVPYTS